MKTIQLPESKTPKPCVFQRINPILEIWPQPNPLTLSFPPSFPFLNLAWLAPLLNLCLYPHLADLPSGRFISSWMGSAEAGEAVGAERRAGRS